MAVTLLFILMCCFLPWRTDSAPPLPITCPAGWWGNEEDQTCYKPYHHIHLTWNHAKSFCQKEGGDLAVIGWAYEYIFMRGILSGQESYWLRFLVQIDNDGNTKWLDMSNFNTDQLEEVLCISFTGFFFHHHDCNEIHSFLCQTAPTMCPDQWTGYTDSQGNACCIKMYTDQPTSWYLARDQCGLDEGHLIAIKNEDTNDFVKGLIEGPSEYWIGTNLSSVVPNLDDVAQPGSTAGNLRCNLLHNEGYQGYRVSENDCEETYPYICQKDRLKRMNCKRGWKKIDLRCFKVYTGKETKKNASDICREKGGHLAIFPDRYTLNGMKDRLFQSLHFWYNQIEADEKCGVVHRTINTRLISGVKSCFYGLPSLCRKRGSCNEDCFRTSKGKGRWYSAISRCEQEEAWELFSGNLSAFGETIKTILPIPMFYIGLERDLESQGNPFKWVANGTDLGGFSPWEPGQPNDKNCVVIVFIDNNQFKWRNVDCDEEAGFICEKEADVETYESCPKHWTLGWDLKTCYMLFPNDYRNWESANESCDTLDGHLLVINDEEDLAQFVEKKSSGLDRLWIGAKKDVGQPMSWSRGNRRQLVSYNRWVSGMTFDGTQTDCGYINRKQNYFWDIESCSENMPYLCQKDDVNRAHIFCPQGYTAFKRSCFKVVNQWKNWEDARTFCGDEGGDLAIAPDRQTDDFIAGLLTYRYQYWLGLHRVNNGNYIWLDGTLMTTECWARGEPTVNLAENCVQYLYTTTEFHSRQRYHLWNNIPCDRSMHFVCEHPGNSDIKEVDIDGQPYYISYWELSFRDAKKACESYNMEQLFIQSNVHFKRIQGWVSNTSYLQDDDIWIRTNKPLYWDFNTWMDNDFVSPESWVSDIQDHSVCSPGEECCVVLTKDNNKTGHYLVNRKCSEEALYFCVKENTPAPNKLPSPKLESDNSKSMGMLRELTVSNEDSLNNKCPCRCGMIVILNLTQNVLDELKDKIVKELIVKTDNLTATVMKKVSAKDSRPSSQTFGYVAIMMLLVPVILIVALDMTRFCQNDGE